MNIPEVSTLQILDPSGNPVPDSLGVFNVPDVTRIDAGTYICIVISTIDNSTVNETSNVVVQCKLLFLQNYNGIQTQAMMF